MTQDLWRDDANSESTNTTAKFYIAIIKITVDLKEEFTFEKTFADNLLTPMSCSSVEKKLRFLM